MPHLWTAGPVLLGLALGPDGLTAVRLDRKGRRDPSREVWSRRLKPGTDAAAGDELHAALTELGVRLGIRRAAVAVAILPPLVELRRLALPPIGALALERVLARDAGRYFVRAASPQVVSVEERPRLRRAAPHRLAVAVDALLLEHLYAAIEKIGWRVRQVVPAQAAWAACAGRALGHSAVRAAVVVLGETITEVMILEAGGLRALRRLPAADDARHLLEELSCSIGGPSQAVRLVVIGDQPRRDAVVAAVAGCGFEIAAGAHAGVLPDDPAAAAAVFARAAAGPALVPEPVARAAARRVVRIGRRCLVAAAVLLGVAGGLKWWGLERELAQVEAARHAIRRAVTEAMTVRGALDSLDNRVRGLERAEAGRVRWSSTLASVTAAVPVDAHLVGWHAQRDTLRLEGEATRAADVFQALQGAGRFQGVRADAPIRQELRDSEPPVEHFSVTARLGLTGKSEEGR